MADMTHYVTVHVRGAGQISARELDPVIAGDIRLLRFGPELAPNVQVFLDPPAWADLVAAMRAAEVPAEVDQADTDNALGGR